MVKKSNGVAKAKGVPACSGAGDMAEPSKANASSPGLLKTSKFKKRKVKPKKTAAASAAAVADEVASVGADTAGSDALALVSMPQPAAIADASPVAEAPKPATDAEGLVSAPMPANAEASASAAKQNPADTNAAAASSKGKGVSADNSGGGKKMKNRKKRARERSMAGKGKETEDGAGMKGKGSKAVAKKEGKGEDKGAGFIFMCNQQTKQECYQKRLFGLPIGKIGMVKKIRAGTKLFLYDFDLKLLYGVYKAASNGRINLVKEAFHGMFPAQVKFKIDRDCLPLRESSFKHAIKENYNAKSKFHPELSSKQVQKLIALFKPANVPQSIPNNRLDERHHYEERRQPYHFEGHWRSLPTGEVRQPRFDDQRHPAVIHVPVEDPYRAPHFAPLPVESRLGPPLANVQDDHHISYRPAHLAPEPQHIPLALDSRRAPLALERQHVHSVPEPRHVPPVYRTSAPSDDPYYRSVADLGSQRFSDRTVAERTARDPIITRDHTTLPRELSAHTERSEELYRTGGTRAHVEELYPPGEFAVRADRVGITQADRLEERYRAQQLATQAVDLPRHPTYIKPAYETNPAYAEPSQRSYMPVSSRYHFSGGPMYQ